MGVGGFRRVCVHDRDGNKADPELRLPILLRESYTPASLIPDPTRNNLVHNRRVPRHPSPRTTRLDLGRIHSPLARPYSSYIPNSPLSRYPQSPSRRQAHWDGPSSQRRYDASQRSNTAGLEAGSTYLPPRPEGEYWRTSVYGLQHLETA
jgi:hypothetical protein